MLLAGLTAALPMTMCAQQVQGGDGANWERRNRSNMRHVLLLSVDGMHAVDLLNCAKGMQGVNSGAPYCPNLAALGEIGVNYVAASTTKPSDSFPA